MVDIGVIFLLVVVGAFVVTLLSLEGIQLLVAITVTAGVVASVAGLSPKLTPGVLIATGIVSGALGTATTVGGPPVALIYQHRPGREVRAIVGMTLFLGGGISFFWLALFGRFGLSDIWYAGIFLPAVAIGFYLSRSGAAYLDQG